MSDRPELLLFIHGWRSSGSAWGSFPQLVRDDAQLSQRYQVGTFDYDTALSGKGFPVRDIAEFLRTEMETIWADYSRVAIIAHSQGGLVARRYIADCFNRDNFCRVNQVLFFATPHSGALAAKLASKLPLAESLLHPQTKGLAYDSPELQALYLAEAQCDAHLRVRTKFVVAADDQIVGKTSAWGTHGPGDYFLVPGETHGSIVKPDSSDSYSFRIARNFLLEPTAAGLVDADRRQPLLQQKWSDEEEPQDERDRFVFWTRSIPLLGRDNELAEIDDFLGNPGQRFMWKVILGPGGVGKSRLALEAILRQRSGWWHAGFLNERADGPDWSTWQPRLPTFIVIDYAANSVERVGELIEGLAEREGTLRLKHPVRLLLLERQTSGSWLDRVLVTSRKGKNCRAPDLKLGPPESLWPLFEAVWSWHPPATPLPSEEQTLFQFANLDPQRRPIFAMLMADAIGRHGAERQWSREALLEDVLLREREQFWRPAARRSGLDPAHIEKEERAVAVATMMYGLPVALMQRDSSGLLPTWDRDKHRALFNTITHVSAKAVAPLAPDLLGEFFVLNLFERDLEDGKRLFEFACLHEPHAVGSMFARCGDDFPEHPAIDIFNEMELSDKDLRLAWGRVVTTMIMHRQERAMYDVFFSRTKAEEEAFNDLQKATYFAMKAEAEKAGLIKRRPSELVEAPSDASAEANRKNSETLYEDFYTLVSNHPDESELRLAFAHCIAAMCAPNFIFTGPGWKNEQYFDLCSMLDEFPDDSELRYVTVRTTCSKVLSNRQDNLDGAQKLYGVLKNMVETERDDQRLRHLQAHAAAHLISGFKIDAINSAVSLRFEIQELIDAYPDEPELRGSFADATENLVGVVLPADIASAQQRYAELRNLAVSYPAEPGLRHSQAKVAERLMHEFSSKKLLSEAESLQADVRKLAEQFPDDQELRYALATSIIHMIDIVAPTDLASAKTHYTKVQQFKDIPLLGSWLASVAHDLFKRCIRKGEANTALAMQDDLRDLAETYPNDTLIKRYLEWSEEELRKSDAPQAKDTPS